MAADKQISVLIVDDHMVVRRGLALVLEEAAGFVLVGAAESGEEAIDLCRQLHPDVVLMDVKMEGLGGIEAARQIGQHTPETRVIALSTFAAADAVSAMQSAGARAYLLKDVSAAELTQTIRRVAAGEIIAPTQIEGAPAPPLSATTPASGFDLGTQQTRVLTLMAKGFTNPEIAKYLSVSRPTVSYHVSAILRKLDVSNRSEAVAVAVQYHLTDMSDL